jgi:hypothetical protein
MAYQNMAVLSFDSAFRDRVIACAKEQALIFKDDQRPEFHNLAWAIIYSPGNAQGLVDLVCVAPGFGDVTDPSAIDDAEILSAVQANWATYGAVTTDEHTPAAAPPAE